MRNGNKTPLTLKEAEKRRKAAIREKQKVERAIRRKALWLSIKTREIFAEAQEEKSVTAPAIVSFDLERAGFAEDDIIEIGAVRMEAGAETFQKFHALVRPRTKMNRYVEKLTGITGAELAGEKPLPEVLPDFLRFVGNAVVVGHAIGDNDIVQINLALRRYKLPGRRSFLPRFIDTEHVAHRLFDHLQPPVEKFGLSFLLARYGLEMPAKHRAVEDAIASYVLLSQLLTDETLAGNDAASDAWGTRQDMLLAALKEECRLREITEGDEVPP